MISGQDGIDLQLNLESSQFKRELDDADRMARGFARSLTSAFVGVTARGKGLSDVVASLGLSLSRIALSAAFRPLEQGLSGLVQPLTEGLFSGVSQIFTPQITPFAKGGVIAQPTYFPMSSGLGLAGERGAEAIIPLSRGSDGRLGVKLEGAGAASSVTINIATNDVESFRKSQSEIASTLARMVARGQRGL